MRQGYFSAGDMAVRDEGNYYYIVDRKKDMILTGGVNVFPHEIEEVLLSHPKVADAAVVGVPDPYWGETIRGVVVLKPGKQATEEEIISFCNGKIARFKHPRAVSFVGQIPRSPVGKTLKQVLRNEIAAQGTSDAVE